MRRIVVGLVAIALFTAAAVGAIWALTRGDAGAGSAPVVAEPQPEPTPPPPLPPIQLPPGMKPLHPDASPPPVVVYGPAKPPPRDGSWEAVPVAARPASLGPLGGAIGRGLIELQPRLAACFDEDTAARFGPQAHTVALDPTQPNTGTPVLVLEIETASGEAVVYDAPVDTRGTASDGVIACAQTILRGRRFPFPQAQPGQKYRVLHSLIP